MFDSVVLCAGCKRPPTAVHSFIPLFFIDILTRFLLVSFQGPSHTQTTYGTSSPKWHLVRDIGYSVHPHLCVTQRQILEILFCNFVSRIGRLIGKSWGYWICNKSLSSVTCIMLWFKFILRLNFISQGAKKVIFTACHLGKLKLAFISPNVISTSPSIFLMSRIHFTVPL